MDEDELTRIDALLAPAFEPTRLPLLSADEARAVLALLRHFGDGEGEPAALARDCAGRLASRLPAD